MESAVATLPMAKAARRSWRPRFFLRTLLLFVLTLSSAATLWWNRGPWHIAYVIDDVVPITAAGFTPDGKYVYTLTDPNGREAGSDVTLRDAHSGALHRRLHSAEYGRVVSFSPAGDCMLLYHGGIYCGDSVRRMWNPATGDEIKAPDGMPRGHIDFSPNNDFATGYHVLQPHEAMIVSLPEWKEVTKVEHFLGFAHDQRAFLHADTKRTVNETLPKSTVNLVSLPGLVTERTWDVDGYVAAASLSPDNRVFAIQIQANDYKLAVLDAATSRELASGKGQLLNTRGGQPFSSDGRKLSIWNSPGMALWDFEANTTTPIAQPEKRGAAVEHSVCGSGGKLLIDLTDMRWHSRISFPVRGVCLDRDETCCLCYAAPDEYGKLPLDSRAAVFRKVRPDGWRGMAWLPELWMTLALAGGLVWSVCRKR